MKTFLILMSLMAAQVFADDAIHKEPAKTPSQDATMAMTQPHTELAQKIFDNLCDIETAHRQEQMPPTRAAHAVLPHKPPPGLEDSPLDVVKSGRSAAEKTRQNFFSNYWESAERHGLKQAEAKDYLKQHPKFDMEMVKSKCDLTVSDKRNLWTLLQSQMATN